MFCFRYNAHVGSAVNRERTRLKDKIGRKIKPFASYIT